MSSLAAEIKRLLAEKKKIEDQIKVLKLQSNYKEISNNLTDTKNQLYQYLIHNHLEEIDGITLKSVLPPAVKKLAAMQRKKDKYLPVLSEHVEEEEVEELAEELAKL